MIHVVFDVGNVLIDWDIRRVYRGHFADDAAIEAFLSEIGFGPWNLALDRGGTWASAVADHAARHPHLADLIALADRDWQRSVSGPIAGSVEILNRLAADDVPLYAITNFSAEKWAESLERFPFLGTAFRDVVVSAHEGLVKPDPALFRRFLDRNSLASQDCVFIDDSPANICAADLLGFDAIQFQTPEKLAVQLAKRGLPV